jgi:hypothetical protein
MTTGHRLRQDNKQRHEQQLSRDLQRSIAQTPKLTQPQPLLTQPLSTIMDDSIQTMLIFLTFIGTIYACAQLNCFIERKRAMARMKREEEEDDRDFVEAEQMGKAFMLP